MTLRVNLIPSYRLVARQRAVATRWWLRGGLVFALMLIGCLAFFQTRLSADPAALAARLDEASSRVDDNNQQVLRLETELAAAQRRVDANHAVTNQPDYAVLLALLAGTLDDQIVLRSFDFESIRLGSQNTVRKVSDPGHSHRPPGFEVNAAGFAQDQRAVAGYVLRLEQIGLFHEVRLVSTRREPVPFGDGHAIAFQVRCYLATESPQREAGDE